MIRVNGIDYIMSFGALNKACRDADGSQPVAWLGFMIPDCQFSNVDGEQAEMILIWGVPLK